MCRRHCVHPWSQCILMCFHCTVQMSKDRYPESSLFPWILEHNIELTKGKCSKSLEIKTRRLNEWSNPKQSASHLYSLQWFLPFLNRLTGYWSFLVKSICFAVCVLSIIIDRSPPQQTDPYHIYLTSNPRLHDTDTFHSSSFIRNAAKTVYWLHNGLLKVTELLCFRLTGIGYSLLSKTTKKYFFHN